MLNRITQFIKENGIKKFVYHTWRELEDDNGKKIGEIRVLALEDGVARTEYHCPECGKEFMEEKEWKRPFNVKCKGCGQLIRVPRLKDAVKKRK